MADWMKQSQAELDDAATVLAKAKAEIERLRDNNSITAQWATACEAALRALGWDSEDDPLAFCKARREEVDDGNNRMIDLQARAEAAEAEARAKGEAIALMQFRLDFMVREVESAKSSHAGQRAFQEERDEAMKALKWYAQASLGGVDIGHRAREVLSRYHWRKIK